jgi:hypothetical protein
MVAARTGDPVPIRDPEDALAAGVERPADLVDQLLVDQAARVILIQPPDRLLPDFWRPADREYGLMDCFIAIDAIHGGSFPGFAASAAAEGERFSEGSRK